MNICLTEQKTRSLGLVARQEKWIRTQKKRMGITWPHPDGGVKKWVLLNPHPDVRVIIPFVFPAFFWWIECYPMSNSLINCSSFFRITNCKNLFWKYSDATSICYIPEPYKHTTSTTNSHSRPASCKEHWFMSVQWRRVPLSVFAVSANGNSSSEWQHMEHPSCALHPPRFQLEIPGQKHSLNILSHWTHFHGFASSANLSSSAVKAHRTCITDSCYAALQQYTWQKLKLNASSVGSISDKNQNLFKLYQHREHQHRC